VNINEALENIKKLTGTKFTQTELATALGKTRSDINSKIKRQSELKLSDISKIQQYFFEKYNIKINLIENTIQNSSTPESNFINIPVENADFTPFAYGVSSNQTYKISKELARDIKIEKCKTKMIFATGDSMYPTIEGGDSVLLNSDNKEICDGKIYCIKLNGKYLIKRLQVIPPDKIKVVSDNKDKYDSFYINADDDSCKFSIVGQVCWWGRIAR